MNEHEKTAAFLPNVDHMNVKQLKAELDLRKWRRPNAGQAILRQTLRDARASQDCVVDCSQTQETSISAPLSMPSNSTTTQSTATPPHPSGPSPSLLSLSTPSLTPRDQIAVCPAVCPAVVATTTVAPMRLPGQHYTPRWSRNDMARLIHVIRDPSCAAEFVRVSPP